MNFIETRTHVVNAGSAPNPTSLQNPPLRMIIKKDDPNAKIQSKLVVLAAEQLGLFKDQFKSLDTKPGILYLQYRDPSKATKLLGQGTYKKVFKGTIEDDNGNTVKIARLVTTLFPNDEKYHTYLDLWHHENKIMDKLEGAKNVLQQITNFAYMGSRHGEECAKYNVITPLADVSLHDYMKAIKNITCVTDQYQIFKGALTGLAELHRRGIMHLDIKEANLLLDFQGDLITALICDFGLSQIWEEIQDPGVKGKKITMSTYNYMSPEQCKYTFIHSSKENLDKITLNRDVWALGLIFYRIYHGHPHPLINLIDKFVNSEDRVHKLRDQMERYNDKMSPNEKQELELKALREIYTRQYNDFVIDHQNLSQYINDLPSILDTFPKGNRIEILIMNMLHPDPEKRISAEDALKELVNLGTEYGFENYISTLTQKQVDPQAP